MNVLLAIGILVWTVVAVIIFVVGFIVVVISGLAFLLAHIYPGGF
jgi:hypothetical protein